MEKRILHILSEQLKDNKISLSTNYKEHPAWSSLKALIVLNEIELQTGVLISANGLKHNDTIAALCKEIVTLNTAHEHR